MINDRKSINRLNKENTSYALSYSGRRSKDHQLREIDEASKILKRKMKQMEADETVRDTIYNKNNGDSDYDDESDDDDAAKFKKHAGETFGARKSHQRQSVQ